MKEKISLSFDGVNFLGTYLTENGSTAVVVSRSAMVVDGKKHVIWVGFVRITYNIDNFCVWDKEGKNKAQPGWNLKEAVREQAY